MNKYGVWDIYFLTRITEISDLASQSTYCATVLMIQVVPDQCTPPAQVYEVSSLLRGGPRIQRGEWVKANFHARSFCAFSAECMLYVGRSTPCEQSWGRMVGDGKAYGQFADMLN